MLIFAETNKSNFSHLAINIAMIKILLNSKKCYKLFVFGDKKQIFHLKGSDLDGFDNKYIKVLEGRFYMWPIKIILEFISILRVFIKAKNSNSKLVFFSSLFVFSHFSFFFIRFFFKESKVVIALHGELQYLFDNRKLKYRFLSFYLKLNILNKNDKHTKILVYSDFIKNNLLKSYPYLAKKIISIDHPFNYSEINDQIDYSYPLSFGCIGIASKEKNTHFIFELAKHLKTHIINEKLRFIILGKTLSNISPYGNDFVNYNISKSMVPAEEYYQNIMKTDFFLFFYDNYCYNYSPSGVLFDSFQFEKPLVVIKNDMFVYYFNRFGDIGYLCDDIDQMKSVIGNLTNNFDSNRYSQQVLNIKKIKKAIGIDLLSENFWLQTNSFID
jgi:glycosyltransferase involved in cell wall biosynthesis